MAAPACTLSDLPISLPLRSAFSSIRARSVAGLAIACWLLCILSTSDVLSATALFLYLHALLIVCYDYLLDGYDLGRFIFGWRAVDDNLRGKHTAIESFPP